MVAALSGGVDSAVAAAILVEQGHDVTGVFLRNGIEAGPAAKRARQGCCGIDDAADAAGVARRLGIPFYALDYADGFDRLIAGFADAYARGRTPNPCIVCNRDLKFGRLLAFADALGAEAVATGHYARLVERGGRCALRAAVDCAKDQTYVLFPLDQAQLRRSRFPLGELTKREVRERAAALGLSVAEKPESMEICFVPGGDYRAIVRERAPDALREGPIVDAASGARVGRHGGVGTVTIGQRRGVALRGTTPSSPARPPSFVTAIDPETNVVTTGPRESVMRRRVVVSAWNGVARPLPEPGEALRGVAAVRRAHRPSACVVRRVPGEDRRVEALFDDPVEAPAPGQALVFWDDVGVVLGGGWIASSS